MKYIHTHSHLVWWFQVPTTHSAPELRASSSRTGHPTHSGPRATVLIFLDSGLSKSECSTTHQEAPDVVGDSSQTLQVPPGLVQPGHCICGGAGGGSAGGCTAALWWPSIAMWSAVVGFTSAGRSCLVLYWQPSWGQVSIVTLLRFSSFFKCFFLLLQENVYIIESPRTNKNENNCLPK